jgi:hypothetical protein
MSRPLGRFYTDGAAYALGSQKTGNHALSSIEAQTVQTVGDRTLARSKSLASVRFASAIRAATDARH